MELGTSACEPNVMMQAHMSLRTITWHVNSSGAETRIFQPKVGQYYGFRCPGPFGHQVISSHSIEMGPCFQEDGFQHTAPSEFWRMAEKANAYSFFLKLFLQDPIWSDVSSMPKTKESHFCHISELYPSWMYRENIFRDVHKILGRCWERYTPL